ncbi:hypothetical protein ANCCAN_11963 [Ancylostoma caninum]|uniref:Uncharacterized protein n=1 Tax=Ancylostoma caninum TaxID=29170 RepID=A0A368GCH0_ANCCA|nr:hypothetical protein ANCCAN_11963 [Ancylostoma caninum]
MPPTLRVCSATAKSQTLKNCGMNLRQRRLMSAPFEDAKNPKPLQCREVVPMREQHGIEGVSLYEMLNINQRSAADDILTAVIRDGHRCFFHWRS